MLNNKIYIKALKKYEQANNSYQLLTDYVNNKSSTLARLYCEGQIYLPSFMLIKKLHQDFYSLSNNDSELTELFNNAEECSKLFYYKMIGLVQGSKKSMVNFETKFEKELQPLGQQLVDSLTNIKYRVRILKNRQESKITIINKYLALRNIFKVNKLINRIIYKITLLQSTRHNLARLLYYSLTALTIAIFWIANLLFLTGTSPIYSTFINIVIGIVIIVISIATYPMGDFGKIDISGKNIVAYKYKLFFNNYKNNKIIDIFTLKHPDQPGQEMATEVESRNI